MTTAGPEDGPRYRVDGIQKAAVYNRFWHSMGGGERHSGKIAEVLAADGVDVDLIGHTHLDTGALADHLGLDLRRVRFRYLPDRGDDAMAAVSADYDLFVNGSYMSRLAPRSRHAAYLCFFPTPPDHDLPRWRRAMVAAAGPVLRGARPAVSFNIGWYPPEGGHRRRWTWTNGDGILSVAPGGQRHLRADLGRPGSPGPTPLRVTDVEGNVLATIEVGRAFAPARIPLPPSARGTELALTSGTFQPGDAGEPGGDVRELGVAVSRARVVSSSESPRARLALRFPWLLRDPRDLGFLDAYDVVMANSGFTKGWISALWGWDADVLYPPIQVERLSPAAQREPAVVSVGRFFAPGLGHAKRQLEMVRWFGDAHRSGELAGWRMHVVGGCEDSQLPYLAEVRAAAAGLPVEIHPNAPRSDVEKLLSTSSVFWSATGYGDDERTRPWTAEHFGMTTVEAMAGGCVPVVIDRAGQREIVRHGVDGFRWETPAQLVSLTRRVAGDRELAARLSASARDRAGAYSDAAFAASWRAIVARRGLLAP